MTDSFPPWNARVRKDPLGALSYNRLLERAGWAEAIFLREHASTTLGTGAGEHNVAEIPREVGSIYTAAGPSYAKEGFRYASGISRPALGTAALALAASPPYLTTTMAAQVQNMSETGINKPVLTSFQFISATEVRFYNQYLTSALGGGNAWATEDANFCAALHSVPVGNAWLPLTSGRRKQRGDTLTEYGLDYNQQVQFDADLWAKFVLEHSTAGVHTNREVARTFAHVENNAGNSFRIVRTSARNALTVAWQSTGVARLTNTSAWTLSAQPFVMVDYARANGGAEGDIFVACCPRSLVTTTTFDVYLYQYSGGNWARADTDFYVSVHAS